MHAIELFSLGPFVGCGFLGSVVLCFGVLFDMRRRKVFAKENTSCYIWKP